MIKKEISILKKILDDLCNEEKNILLIIRKLSNCLKLKKRIFICGNGGSAAEAEHLSAEFLVRLKPENNRQALPIISLTQNAAVITACGNDFGFENIFSRTLEGLGKVGDILWCLSTSGNSKNIVNVLKKAKKKGITSISFLGNNGGKARALSDISFIVQSNNVARVQECHLFLSHYILSEVEKIIIK
jgi:D-sedoheptulose 7-phosphate isomerase